jgi:general secretion pathway protein K
MSGIEARRARPGRRQRGIALLVVLWACTLLAILLGGFATLARTESIQTRYLSSRVQLRYLAEAGVMRALAECTGVNGGRWVGDGRPYTLHIDGHEVDIRIQDELGKMDINAADAASLQRLFVAAGEDDAAASQLAANILRWRAPSDANTFGEQGGKRDAELSSGPRYREFETPEQLQMVSGLTPALYRKVASAITVWSSRPQPTPALAPALALASLPNMDMARAEHYVAQRVLTDAHTPPPALSNGQAPGAWRGGPARTVVASAVDREGTKAQVSVTFRLTSEQGGMGYSVLRWQEDSLD